MYYLNKLQIIRLLESIYLLEDINEFIKNSGYKSKDKIARLIKKYGVIKKGNDLPNYPINKFPLKKIRKNIYYISLHDI